MMATEPITNSMVADTLERASDEIMIRGWTQGQAQAAAGGVCILGALTHACGIPMFGKHVHPPHDLYVHPMYRRVRQTLPVQVPVWNDTYSRTEDEVHDLLRNTAKQLRETV